MIKTIEKYPVLSMLVLVLLMLLPSLGELKVTIMEARNFISAREMLSENNWILTTLNGEQRYEKPPLPTWITALFGLVFGIKNVYVLRLPGVIMVWLTGVFVYLFSKELTQNKRNSFINGIICVSSFYIVGIIVEAPWDIYTHGFMMLAIYFMYKNYQQYHLKRVLLAVVFIACSVMSKGPISLYALLLPFLLAFVVVYGVKNNFITRTLFPLGLGVVLGSGWFVYVRLADPEAFLKIAEVETANWSSYNVKPFYYYWNFFIQSGIWTIPAVLGLLYPYMIKRVKNVIHYKLSLFWTLFSVILLSLVPEKKARYLVPVLLPLAINTGFYIYYILEKCASKIKKAEAMPVFFHFGILALVAMLFPLVAFFMFQEVLLSNSTTFLIYCLGLFISGSFLLFFLYFKVMWSSFYTSVFIVILLFVAVIPVNPGFANQNINYNSIAQLKADAEKENVTVYLLDAITPENLWEYGGIIPKIQKTAKGYIFPEASEFGVLVNDSTLINSGEFNQKYEIEKKEIYDLNLGKFNTRKHKPRYVNNYYVFTKK
ncbi:4-amino-4-deoxy-L-arabinose transferase [Draconibacterium orientale]|uniref:4-amino-4-deoxy-L-arabinose transferase n=1 Tax=Draconibacterium orientale TaxID=1168034 RepID=X5E0W2_9BACT|nr:glycosyltransferase family 39 protein [Draconibacterium orientale]AHW61120.1 glycosyltransferase [Draconibacterium orientale]SEU14539.1 4-amino-4-deoxy-L-arabinose transferase [Draconibacterium orientale]